MDGSAFTIGKLGFTSFETIARALHNCPLAALLEKSQILAYRKYASTLTFLRALPANNFTALSRVSEKTLDETIKRLIFNDKF